MYNVYAIHGNAKIQIPVRNEKKDKKMFFFSLIIAYSIYRHGKTIMRVLLYLIKKVPIILIPKTMHDIYKDLASLPLSVYRNKQMR
jgi:hypothetical protein